MWELASALLGVNWLTFIREVFFGEDCDLEVTGFTWVHQKLELEVVVWHHCHELVNGLGALGSIASSSAVLDLDVVRCTVCVSENFHAHIYLFICKIKNN